MKKTTQTESKYAQTFAQITWQYVTAQNYPKLDTDGLKRLQEIFYFRLEDRILSSMLEHADDDILTIYKELRGHSESNEGIFDYEAFDTLFALVVGDEELKPKIEADIAQFSQDFAEVAHRYL